MARFHLPVVFALVGIVALGLGAATLQTAVRTDGGAGTTQDADASLLEVQEPPTATLQFRPPTMVYRAFLGLYVVGVVIAAYVFYRWYGVSFYATLLAGFLATLVILALLEPAGLDGYRASNPSVFAGEATATDDASHRGPSAVLYFVLVGGFLAVGWALYRSAGDDVAVSRSSPADGSVAETAAIGRAAATSAARLERDADVDNEIYRAWREMTRHLSVSRPASSTPGEFGEAAVEAGIDPEDVAALTELFEAVRYGDASPTDDREARAIAVLRQIEATYAGE